MRQADTIVNRERMITLINDAKLTDIYKKNVTLTLSHIKH